MWRQYFFLINRSSSCLHWTLGSAKIGCWCHHGTQRNSELSMVWVLRHPHFSPFLASVIFFPQSYKWKDPSHKAMQIHAVTWSGWWREDKVFYEMYAFDKGSFIFLRRCVLLPRHLSIMAVELYKFTVAPIEMVYINGISCSFLLKLISCDSCFYP